MIEIIMTLWDCAKLMSFYPPSPKTMIACMEINSIIQFLELMLWHPSTL